MNKIRIIATSFILLLCIQTVSIPIQVEASSNISAFARLAGTAGPVLTALTSCTLGLIFDKTYKALREAQSEAEGVALYAQVTEDPSVAGANADEETAAVNAKLKSMCLTPVERAAAQVILNTITTETVNWINGGMNGAPMYITDPAKSFQDLQRNAIGHFADVITGDTAGNYPFGKMLLQDTLTQLNNTFENDMKTNMKNALPQGITPVNFTDSINNGGWGAFEAQFMPNNNPIGSKYKIDDHLAQILAGTSYSPAKALSDKLKQNGFLDQVTCLSEGPNPGASADADPSKVLMPGDPPNPKAGSICLKTKIVTPGSVVFGKLNDALGANQQSLISGQQLDASITSIFDAMMSHFLQDGLASLSDDTGNSNSSSSLNGTNSGNTSTPATVQGNATGGSLCGVSSAFDWYAQYPTFDIRYDLTDKTDSSGKVLMNTDVPPAPLYPGLITRENTLRLILVDQDQVLKWLINAVYQLDMCIPGPSSINDPNQSSSIESKIFGQLMQNYNYPGSATDQVNEIYNAQFLSDNFGVRYYPDDKIKDPEQVQKIMKTLIQRYHAALNHVYGNLNEITAFSKYQEYWGKLPAYQQELADNQAKIEIIDGNVAQLKSIVTRVNNWSQRTDLDDAGKTRLLNTIKDQFNALIPDLDVSPYMGSPAPASTKFIINQQDNGGVDQSHANGF